MPQDFRLSLDNPALGSYFKEKTDQALQGQSDWSFLTDLVKGPSVAPVPVSMTDSVLATLTRSLVLNEGSSEALDGLQALAKANRKALEQFMQKPEASQLLPRLLYLTESPNETISQGALQLNAILHGGLMQNGASSLSFETLYKTIRNGLLETSSTSVSSSRCISKASLHNISPPYNATSDADKPVGFHGYSCRPRTRRCPAQRF